MKRCPKCNAEYFDNMLEFCLDDGTRLRSEANAQTVSDRTLRQTVTATKPGSGTLSDPTSAETVVIPRPDAAAKAPDKSNQMSAEDSPIAKAIEMAPIVVALAHNWWQWIYLEKTPTYSITEFLLSANFLMWLLLLAAGVAISLLALKNSRRKTLSVISLVVLAINLILFLVPRR